MGFSQQYPMNFFSRTVTNSSGASPATQYLLCHADRALVTGGTVFIDQSSYDHAVFTKGSAIVQSTAVGYFGTSGILFTGSTASVDAARIVWTMTASTATGRAMQIENFIYFTSLNSAGMTWWNFTNSGNTDYANARFWQDTAGVWKVNIEFYQAALGKYLSGDWALNSMATGSVMHIAMVRGDSVDLTQGNRIGVFQNGSQLDLVTGGFPSDRVDDWLGCGFGFPPTDRLAFGGSVNSGGGANPYAVIGGWMDEIRYLVDTFEGVSYVPVGTTTALVYSFAVPTAPYLPADGTFNITAKTLVLNSSDLSPATDGLLNLGQSGTQWLNLWSKGTAYFNQVGQSFLMVGSSHVNYRDTTTYMFSSAAGYLTLVSGTQIDLQANIGVAAKNFIFDTATGVKIATGTNQKLGFFNSTPIVQPSGDILAALSSLGLVSSPTIAGSVITVSTTSTTYNLTTANDYLICESATAFAVNLPAAIGSYDEFIVKNIGAANVTVTPNTIDLLDGSSTMVLAQWAKTRVFDFSAAVITGGNDSYTKLLLNCEGTDGSTTFTDEAALGNTVTTFGNAQIDTAQFEFGSSSLLCDGNGDYLSVAYSTGWSGWLNVSMAIEAWVMFAATGGNQCLFSRSSSGSDYFYFAKEGGNLRFRDYNGGNNIDFSNAVTFSSMSWYHVAVSRKAAVGSFYMFVNGSLQGSGYANASSWATSTAPLHIGGEPNINYYFNGWMDAIRLSVGTYRWDATFTPAVGVYDTSGTPGKWLSIA